MENPVPEKDILVPYLESSVIFIWLVVLHRKSTLRQIYKLNTVIYLLRSTATNKQFIPLVLSRKPSFAPVVMFLELERSGISVVFLERQGKSGRRYLLLRHFLPVTRTMDE